MGLESQGELEVEAWLESRVGLESQGELEVEASLVG